MKKEFWVLSLIALLLVSCGGTSDTESPEFFSSQNSVVSTSDESVSIYEESSDSEIYSDESKEGFVPSFDTSVSVDEKVMYEVGSYYGGYYSSIVSWNNSEDLMQQLYNRLRDGYHPIEYGASVTNWVSNKNADRAVDDLELVNVLYSPVNEGINSTYYNGSGWQREHAFCACLMTGQTTGESVKTLGRATDFHNLFASNNSGNTSRGNKNFGYADINSSSYVDPTKLPASNSSYNPNADYKYDDKNFEPSDEDKGKLARAILYMCVMYSTSENVTVGGKEVTYKPLTLQDGYVSYPTNGVGYDAFAIGNRSTIIDWANTFSVSRLEMQHNESVYGFVPDIHSNKALNVNQGNRNPFIDYPELVDYVFGDKMDEPGELKYLKPSAVSLKLNSTNTVSYAIKTARRSFEIGETFDESCYEIVGINGDYSINESAEFENFNTPYTFTENDGSVGYKEISLLTPFNTIKFRANVTKAMINNCMYYYEDEYSSTSGVDTAAKFSNKKINSTPQEITLAGVTWLFSCQNETKVSNNAKMGLKIGGATATTPACESLTIQSKGDFVFQDHDTFNRIFIALNTASGKAYVLKISVGDSYTSKTITIVYDSSGPKSYQVDLPESMKGQITFNITAIDAAINLKAIGVNLIS